MSHSVKHGSNMRSKKCINAPVGVCRGWTLRARVNRGGGSVVEMTEVLARRLMEENIFSMKGPVKGSFPSANTRVVSKQTSAL